MARSIDNEDLISFTVRLPRWFHDQLVCLAYLKATNRATYTSNLVQARMEALRAEYLDILAQAAKNKGMTPEALERYILDDGKD